MTDATIAEDLPGFVRGDRELAVLEDLGVEVRMSPRQQATFPKGLPVVAATIVDLATGFAAVLPDPSRSRTWALVEMASDVDLPDPEESAAAQTLIDALWRVSSG